MVCRIMASSDVMAITKCSLQAPSLRGITQTFYAERLHRGEGSDGNLPQQSNSRVWGLVPAPQKESPARKRGKYILEGKSR
jgi:hypothetical protein